MTWAVCHAGSSVFPSRTGAVAARVAIAEVAVARDDATPPTAALFSEVDATTRAAVLSGWEGTCAGLCASETTGSEMRLKRTRVFINECDWRLTSCGRERPKQRDRRLRQRQPEIGLGDQHNRVGRAFFWALGSIRVRTAPSFWRIHYRRRTAKLPADSYQPVAVSLAFLFGFLPTDPPRPFQHEDIFWRHTP
jgi:hypothetical protein